MVSSEDSGFERAPNMNRGDSASSRGRGRSRGSHGIFRRRHASPNGFNSQSNLPLPILRSSSVVQGSGNNATQQDFASPTQTHVRYQNGPWSQITSPNYQSNQSTDGIFRAQASHHSPPSRNAFPHPSSAPRQNSAQSPMPRLPILDQSSSSNDQSSLRRGVSGQRASDRALIRGAERPWTHKQELKVQCTGMPRIYTTKDVYLALSRYGNIIRIEVITKTANTSAFVVFQPPPDEEFDSRIIQIGSVSFRVDAMPPSRFFTVPSPVDPMRKYNELNIFYANAIDFGIKVADTTMITMNSVNAHNKVQITLNLQRKEIDIKFPLLVDAKVQNFRFSLPIALLEHIYKVPDKNPGGVTLIIPFDTPPRFFSQLTDHEFMKSFSLNDKTWNDWSSWARLTDVVDRQTQIRLASEPVMNHKNTAIIDIGRWTSYRLSFDSTKLHGPKYSEFSSALADHGVVIKELPHYTLKGKTVSPLWNLVQEEISATHPHFEPSAQESTMHDLLASQIPLPFSIRYQLEACLSNGFLREHNISRPFLEKLTSTHTDHATYILEKITDRQKVHYDPMEIFNTRIRGQAVKNVPSYCVLSRSATITPTMIHVNSPVVETSNRIVRKHVADADRFIRVRFTDEKTEGRIHSQDDDRSEALFNRIRRAMTNGIVVAGRYYEFLAFGNSQFREHGAYFYAPTTSKTADQIRLAMGRFDHIRTVAKFGARLGQCFSTTRAIRSITVKIEMIPDIVNNGYTFTDGVGKLSPLLAKMAAEELGLHKAFDDPPSLFQFRLGGCKGVLAIDPNVLGPTVFIRPSQYKFEAQNVGLEIIRASALATACLNRQLIIVLSTLGVGNFIFLGKQQETVNYLERVTREESVALEKLQRNIDLNQVTLTMAAMVLDGFMRSMDPFMMSLLELWRAYHMKYLKEKARIPIEDGAFVLGCVDETATLRGHFDEPQSRPNATRDEKLETLPEIFLQITDPKNKGHYKIIEGVCVLARNPSLHAGDIRVVRAVNVPALSHMKDVVVLPQTGDRDIANMCSGGDLDGDDYVVIWDSDFHPEELNEPPMDFTPEKPVEKDDPITVADITEFFVTYMKNDSLARIALAHLAQADFNPDGVRDEKCLELARLHSQAVDYPKSGIPAIMNRELRPKKWPHFMENKYRQPSQIYESKNILGMLYDQVKLVDFKPKYENPFDNRILNAFEDKIDEAILQKAAQIKGEYDSALKRLMAKHAIQTEFEAWSVFVLSHNLESRDYTFAEEFGRTVSILKSQYREQCIQAAATSSTNFEQLAPFVTAMYIVTAREMETALKECRSTKTVRGEEVPARKMVPEQMPLISFPWLFVNELGRIATGDKSYGRAIQQGIPVRKKHQSNFTPNPGMGDIETEQGVTHYGGVLKLDFGAQERLEPQAATSTSAVSEPYSWKIKVNPLATPTPVTSGESQSQDMDGEKQHQNNIIEIDFRKEKPSVLDQLKRASN